MPEPEGELYRMRVKSESHGSARIVPPESPERAALRELVEAYVDERAADKEIAAEFVSKKRAARWDIVNEGWLRMDKAIARAKAVLNKPEETSR